MKSQPSFIRTKRSIKLNSIPAVHLNFSRIICPNHSEHNLPLGFNQTLQQSRFFIFRMGLDHRFNAIQNFCNRLQKFRLMLIFFSCVFNHTTYIDIHNSPFSLRILILHQSKMITNLLL